MINVTKIHNLAHKYYMKKVPLLPKIINKVMNFFCSCEIPYTDQIHPTVKFSHKALGVVIGHDTIIGEGTKILQHVTIGGRNGIRANPIIGKGVLIGAGACILGNVRIGDYAKIGANAVVIRDVPAGCTAVGVPAKILNKE